MPFSTKTIISDCCTLAAAISSISVLIDWIHWLMSYMAETARLVESVPVLTSSIERLTRLLVFCAAVDTSADRVSSGAQALSQGTMEQAVSIEGLVSNVSSPLPAVPARTASTAAFNARMLVWNAMSSMVLVMVTICAEDLSIFWVAFMSCSIFVSDEVRSLAARSAAAAQNTNSLVNRSIEDVKTGTAWAPEDTLSALVSTWLATWEISRTTFVRLAWMDCRVYKYLKDRGWVFMVRDSAAEVYGSVSAVRFIVGALCIQIQQGIHQMAGKYARAHIAGASLAVKDRVVH